MSASTATPNRFRPARWVTDELPTIRLTPARITGIYTVLGFGALFLSDVVFATVFDDPLLQQIQAVKGGVEVMLTAGLIFGLTRHSHNQLQDVTDRVQDARNELTLLHRVLRHNLRNDLNLIQGHVAQANRQATDDTLTDHCTVILDTVQQMIRYTEHARSIRKVTEYSTTPINLDTRIPDLLATHSALTDDVDVRTDIPEDVWVAANPLLEDAIAELITNAVTYSDADTPLVDITVAPEPDTVDISITDNGPGIPQTEYDAIQHITESSTVHSRGMGLWFVDWVVTHSDGDLTITHPDDGGTTVTITLPRVRRVDDTATPMFTMG